VNDRTAVLKAIAEMRKTNQLPIGVSVYPNRTKQQSNQFKKSQLLASAYTARETELGSGGSWKASDRDGYPELVRYLNGVKVKPDSKLMANLMSSTVDDEEPSFRRNKLKRQFTSGPPLPAGSVGQ
jgi:hypothetical protein